MSKHRPKNKFQRRRHKPGRPHEVSKEQTGKVQKNRRGFAFIISDNPDAEDAYVDKKAAVALFTGDRVRFVVKQRGDLKSAKILEVISRSRTHVIGQTFRDGKQLFLATPEDDFRIADKKGIEDNQFIIGRIKKYPDELDYGTVTLEENLGDSLSPNEDIKITLNQFGIRHHFPKSLEKEVTDSQYKHQSALKKLGNRKDLRALPLVTIDGADAKDFDDAIYVECPEDENANYILYVSIADVSYFVETGSAIDQEAYARGTSVYFPGHCTPMLPEELSNDLCSLRPKVPRLALTAEIHFDNSGHVLDSFFYESLIQTHARLTYNQVQAHFDLHSSKKRTTKLKESPIDNALDEPLQNAQKLYHLLLNQRSQRGVLEFELPESFIEVDKEGVPLGVRKAERFDAHRLIEEFMIAANRAVAKALRLKTVPAMYRVHEEPDKKCLDEINPMLQSFGLNCRLQEITPKAFSEVLQESAKHKGSPILHKLLLRSQKQAVYTSEPLGHFGLALRDYTHFTSPIRRYPDLMVHRALKELIEPKRNSDKRSDSLEEIAKNCSDRERQAIEAERFILKRKHCWFLLDKVGEYFDGILNWPTKAGAFVELPEYSIEGFLPIEGLGAYYEFDEKNLCLRKRPGKHILTIGEPVRVLLQDVNIEAGEITFMIEPEKGSSTQKPKRKGSRASHKDKGKKYSSKNKTAKGKKKKSPKKKSKKFRKGK